MDKPARGGAGMSRAPKRIMGDLFCGRGGWTKGFQAHGWECWGIDLNPQPLYPGRFIQGDIAQLIELPPADFYCCSSPCEQFSVHGMKHFHPNPKWPWLGIALFEHARNLLEATGRPYVMENVRPAQKFIGTAAHHCGPFYLWGPGVPLLMPQGIKKCQVAQGMAGGWLDGSQVKRLSPSERRAYRDRCEWGKLGGGSEERRKATANVAEIPLEISFHIAQMAGVTQ